MNDVEQIRLLHSFKANLDITGDIGETALHIAITREATESVRVLLQLGANPNIANKRGVCPLQMAIKQQNLSAVTLLVKHNARTDVTFNGTSAIERAEQLERSDIKAVLDGTSELLDQEDSDLVKENKGRFVDLADVSTIQFPKEESEVDPYARYKDPAEVLRKLGRKRFEDVPRDLDHVVRSRIAQGDFRGGPNSKVKTVSDKPPKRMTAKEKQRKKWTVTTAGEDQRKNQEERGKAEAAKNYDVQALLDEAEQVMMAEQKGRRRQRPAKVEEVVKPVEEPPKPTPVPKEEPKPKPEKKPAQGKPGIVKPMEKSLKRVELSDSESESESEPEPEEVKHDETESDESESDDIIAGPQFSQTKPKERERRKDKDDATRKLELRQKELELQLQLLEQKRSDQESLLEQQKRLLAAVSQPIVIPVPVQMAPGMAPMAGMPTAMPGMAAPMQGMPMAPMAMQPAQVPMNEFATMQQRLASLEMALGPVTQPLMPMNLGTCEGCSALQATSVCPLCGKHFCGRCRSIHCNTDCNPSFRAFP